MQNLHQTWSSCLIQLYEAKKKHGQHKNVNICTSLCRFNALSLLSSSKTQGFTDSQPHLDLWEGNGTTNPGNHFQDQWGQENHQEQSRLLDTWTWVKSWTQSLHNILLHRLLMYRLDKHTVRWTESCLNSLAKEPLLAPWRPRAINALPGSMQSCNQ